MNEQLSITLGMYSVNPNPKYNRKTILIIIELFLIGIIYF